ncbi:unnamed protein product [Choristocarpus tenellus]
MGDHQGRRDHALAWGDEDARSSLVPELPGIRGLVLRTPGPNFEMPLGLPPPPPLRLAPYPSSAMPPFSFGSTSLSPHHHTVSGSGFHLRPLCGIPTACGIPSESLPAFADVEAGLRRGSGTHSVLPSSTSVRAPVPAVEPRSMVEYGSGFLRKSCDSCVSSKRRCDGQTPCTRCLRRKKTCHYTERKKCGPRSGAKNPKPNLQRPLVIPHTSRPPLKKMRLSPAPLYPELSSGELSGDTTGPEPDTSDAPSERFLDRSGSGSSWYSLDDQPPPPSPTQQDTKDTVEAATLEMAEGACGGDTSESVPTSTGCSEGPKEKVVQAPGAAEAEVAALLIGLGKIQGSHEWDRGGSPAATERRSA